MDEHRQLLFVNQFLPSSEQKLIDRMRDAATRRITRPPEVTTVLRDIPMDSIADVVVGPRYIVVLFTDGQISRYPYVATVRRLAPSASPATTTTTAPSTTSAPAAAPASGGVGGVGSGAPSAGSAAAAAGSFLQRTAKFRRYESNGRVVLAGGGSSRGGRLDHRSVIIDRSRPMIPASSVPEDLIAQAQDRINDGSEGAEMCIPEELLTLLDSSHGGVLESDLYPPDSFEYLMSSRERRSKLYEKEKEKQKSTKPVIEVNSDTETLRRYEIPLGSISEPWEGLDNKEAAVGQTPRFTHIACTQSEVLAISTDYKLYGWKWSEAAGDVNPHPMFEKMKLADGEVLTHLSACTLRVAVMTSAGRISSWLDTVSCGERLSEALFVPPQKLQHDHQLEQLVVSNHLAVARFPNNVFYWCGLYPVNDRRRIFEKARTRQRKHVTFDTTQIVEGSEVRTKSGPIYSIGCIAANLSGPTPMVGILMENAWSLSEVCRFRLLDPSAYDSDRYDPSTAVDTTETEAESREAAVAQHALVSGNRKRSATDEVFGGEPKMREEPWPISDVIFIHEEVQNDTAIVKIVDGGHCAVEYQETIVSPTDGFATNASKQLASKGDKEKPKQKMRLIRKDELTVVSHKMRYARSPNSMRIEPYRFVLSGSTASKRVISAVADSLGIRALVERRGIASIVRISVCGKTLTSHPLPLHAPSLHSNDGIGGKPTLMNYGDDSILLLRDANGGIIPLVRDAAAGFKEPVYMQLSASSYTALTVKSVKDKERPSWAPKANREAVIISMQGTHPRTLERRLPSLLYAVMGCDEKAVKGMLDILQKEEDLDLSKREIVDARADGNRNILHAAVMNAFASKNSLEADVENPVNVLTNPETRKPADKVRATLDKKWNEMLRTNRSSSGSSISTGAVIVSDSSQTATDPTQGLDILVVPQSQMGEIEIKMEIDDSDAPPLLINPSPIENPKKRQENAIAIVQMIVTHPICMPFLTDLLSGRDISGQTPFMAAVNHRAYSAAREIFKAVQSLFVDPEQGKCNSSMDDNLLPFLFPMGARPDDSPLFILCYNDPCSFTWTGDEHINQDIFECRTCGLTGSLCCCTECAFTCHRNHDCKLKRTSPTAYCDCWEKSCCNALVNGNQHAREELLKSLVVNSNLYTMLNGRGEHILLYLARKLARQQSEQWNYTRRPRRVQVPTSGRDNHVPEHDLDPPKFAKAALVYCLKNWSVIRSLAMIGVRQMDHSMPMAEEIFHLNNQHGSSHLDKFMLIILSKSSDETTEMLKALFNLLTEQHNKARKTRQNLEEVNFIISRFVRSVGRLFILAVIISSAAASTAVSGLSPSKESSSILDRPSIRGITFSGIFGHLRKETSKDSKLKNMGMFIVRCKAFFEHFSVFALHEMAQLADASLAPVRTGILRPCVSLAALLGSSADSIENLEKYINSEPDVTQQLMGVRNDGDGEQREERKEAKKRRKRSSRRDTDREEATSERVEGTAAAAAAAGDGAAAAPGGDRTAFRAPPPAVAGSSDSESDSDSDGEGFSSRRHASQSSALAGNEERNDRTNDEAMTDERRERERNNRFGAFLDQFRSSDDEDEEDEEVDSDSDGEQQGEDDEDEDEEILEGEEGGNDDDGDNDELATSEGDPPLPTEPHNATHRAPPYDTIASREYAMRRIRREEEDERRRRREEDDEDDESSTNNWIPPTFDMPEDYNRRNENDMGEKLSEKRLDPIREEMRRYDVFERLIVEDHRKEKDLDLHLPLLIVVYRKERKNDLANANVVHSAREGRNDQRDEDGDVDMADAGQVEVEVSETRDGTEYNEMDERDGSARTRPEGTAPSRVHSHTVEELEALQAEAAAMAAAATVRAASEREERERREDDDEWTEERRRHEEFIANRGRPAVRMTARRGGPVPPAPAPSGTTAQRGRRNPTTRGGTANSREGRTERSDETVTATSTTPADRGGHTAGGWSYRRPPWITRSLGEAEARRTARDASRVEGEGERGSSSEEKKTEITAVKEDEMPTTLKAAIQLSAAFSFAVRMIGELLPVVAAGSTHAADGLTISPNVRIVFDSHRNIEELNEMEESVRRRAIDHVVTRLEDSWRWLAVVLDHTEAQIKYINAVTSTEESRKKESKEKKKSQRRKSPHGDRGADPSSSTASTTILTSPQSVSKVKRETISCLLGILRAHSGEGGDDIPLVDLDTLRSPALVVDAYLGFVDARAEAEKLFELGKTKVSVINELLGPIEVEKEQEGILGMRRFYQRSNSVSFPGVSFTDAHDTLQLPCGQALPIVERPQLLTSTVEKEVIFGPPASTQERTKEEHDKVRDS
ncbi:ubr-5 [Pristionchus pacificus]|uniref:Ubr-5 n=1 Tax=Pristionchus pacificus TaxID=54126 RepID=A0A2A6BFV6_PRIPA|nr:ubr-5 [Pristionchus pacificus]|eukprot:PDM64691.1 ubr-5 [Pristionchus pacificus]